MIKKKIIWLIMLVTFFLLVCQLNTEAVMLDEKEAKQLQYVQDEIIIKLKSPIYQLLQKENLILSGQEVKAITNIPNKVKFLVKSDTTLEPVFKGLLKKMQLTGKSEAQLNEQTFNKLSQKRKMPVKQPKNYNLSYVYILRNIKTAGKSIETIAKELSADPNMEYAEPNYKMQLYMVPNDTYYRSSGSWGQGYDDLWGVKKIQCGPAWDFSQGQGVTVAVIDSGVDYNHEDLAANIWINHAEIPNNGIDDDKNGYIDDVRGYDFSGDVAVDDTQQAQPDKNPSDYHGHGTHCAGTIAAVGNNGRGVIGVAPKAKIMPLKTFPNSYREVMAEAIRYAADNGAQVLSNSWGPTARRPFEPTIESAITYAHDLSCVIIFAAGNSNDDVAYYSPANYSKTIAVAATDRNDQKIDFSNYGDLINVAAPGGESGSMRDTPTGQHYYVNILSLRAEGTDMYDGAYNYTPGEFVVGNRYYRSRGTSMACPHVAGLAALVMSRFPNFSNIQVENQLIGTADNIDSINPEHRTLLGGRINAYKALTQSPVLFPRVVYKEHRIDDDNIDSSRGNNNGIIDQSEIIELYITLKNYGRVQATGVKATLSTDDPHIRVHTNTVYVGNIPPIIESDSEFVVQTPFVFEVFNSRPLFKSIKFNLDITSVERNFTSTFETTPTNIKVELIAASDRRQTGPKIYNDKVVWQDERDNNVNIYMYDLLTQKEERITSPLLSRQYFPRIYGDKIVYYDDRNVNLDIYLYDIYTKTETRITFDSTDQYRPDIYGDYIVWEDSPNIRMYNISTHEMKQITNNSRQSYIAINNDKIVWRDERNRNRDVNDDIYMYDISEDKEMQITSNIFQQNKPDIYEEKIVWADDRFGGRRSIYFYDLSTGKERCISPEDLDAHYPVIYKNKIVWEDVTYAAEVDIYLYDLITEQEIQIASSLPFSDNKDIYENRIVWVDVDSDSSNIYMATLSYPSHHAHIKVISHDDKVVLNSPIHITAEVSNTGTLIWSKDSFHFRAHAYLPNGAYIHDLRGADYGSCYILPKDIAPGETATMNLVIPTGSGSQINQLGRCEIGIDMVHEGVRWFENEIKVPVGIGNAIVVNPGSSIQQTINRANHWDTIYLRPGEYTGGINVNKPISLIGSKDPEEPEDSAKIVLNGGFINITSDDVTIKDLIIENSITSGPYEIWYTIYANGRSNLNIQNNIIRADSWYGALIRNPGKGISIYNNLLYTYRNPYLKWQDKVNLKGLCGISVSGSNLDYDISGVNIEQNTVWNFTFANIGLSGKNPQVKRNIACSLFNFYSDENRLYARNLIYPSPYEGIFENNVIGNVSGYAQVSGYNNYYMSSYGQVTKLFEELRNPEDEDFFALCDELEIIVEGEDGEMEKDEIDNPAKERNAGWRR